MAISAERMEVLGVNVHDFDMACELFSALLGLKFKIFNAQDQSRVRSVPVKSGGIHSDVSGLSASRARIAIDTTGYLEIVESTADTKQGMRNIHFKVQDIDLAIAASQQLGIKLVANLQAGGLREAIFDAGDLFGVRLCFVEYSEPSMVEALAAEDPNT